MREKLSALLDGELRVDERDDVVRHISRDKELSELWGRYHLYRAVFREESFTFEPDLAEKLSVRLDAHHDPSGSPVVAIGTEGSRPLSHNKRPVLAIAASLVLATIVAVYSISIKPTPSVSGEIALLEQKTEWEMGKKHEDALNGFLVEHGEFISASGMNGLMGYAKFVSYDSGPE